MFKKIIFVSSFLCAFSSEMFSNSSAIKNAEEESSIVFVADQKGASELLAKINKKKNNSLSEKTVEWLVNVFNEDGNLNRSFYSWIAAANSGFFSVYQYVVNFWNAGAEHISDPTNEINPLANQAGDVCGIATEAILEPFLDKILGSVLGHVATSSIANMADNGVTGIVDLVADNFNQFLHPANTNKEPSLKSHSFDFDKLDEILKGENNCLERSAENLTIVFNDETILLKLQSVFSNNENLITSVVLEDEAIQITISSRISDTEFNVLVSYSIVKPHGLNLNEEEIITTIDDAGCILIYIPILSRKQLSGLQETERLADVLYCGVSILRKD